MVVTSLGVGGAERQVIDLCERFSSLGNHCLAISMVAPTEWGRRQLGDSAELFSLNLRPGVPVPSAVLDIRRVVKQWRPTVVHAHMVHSNLLTRFARLGTRQPLVNTIHSVVEGGRILDTLQRATRHIPTWTTAVSESALNRYRTDRLVVKARSSVIHNGIDPDRVLPHSDKILSRRSKYRWIAIGRLEPEKDYLTLLAAVSLLVDEEVSFTLDIAGDGTMEQDLQRAIRSLNLRQHVRLLGHVEDPLEALAQHDALVNSSLYEGLPVTMVEAGLVGRSVVATAVGGTPEIILDGTSGVLAKPRDPRSIADAMKRVMMMTEEDRLAMQQAGRRYVGSRFNLDTIADDWLYLYRRLVDGDVGSDTPIRRNPS